MHFRNDWDMDRGRLMGSATGMPFPSARLADMHVGLMVTGAYAGGPIAKPGTSAVLIGG